ncbi:AIPR protein-domain-containing protein [Hyaloraphidium curvatum]|nr:AIPR protein-domain-containing protein [Hyaloraphidium curvatum]
MPVQPPPQGTKRRGEPEQANDELGANQKKARCCSKCHTAGHNKNSPKCPFNQQGNAQAEQPHQPPQELPQQQPEQNQPAAGPKEPEITFEAFKAEWLQEVQEGTSAVDKGRRFLVKMLQHWSEIPFESDDTKILDARGDGGMDAVYLRLGEQGAEETEGHAWFVFQSKYGISINSPADITREGNKILETLAGKNNKISSAAKEVLDRITTFRQRADPDADRLVYVVLTVDPMPETWARALEDVGAAGRARFGPIFEVKAVSGETIFRQAPVALNVLHPRKINLAIRHIEKVNADRKVNHLEVPLRQMYDFVNEFSKRSGGNLSQLFDTNVRQFLKGTKVNVGMRNTLLSEPQNFELFNNGVRIVCTDYGVKDGLLEVTDPSIPNGCQTTRTIFEVCSSKLASGGTGSNADLAAWEKKLDDGNVSVTIIKIGDPSDPEAQELRKKITRFTNSQNAVRAKDFLALDRNTNNWAEEMMRHGVFLEVQRGGWEAQKAYYKLKKLPISEHPTESANLFELIKVYAAGWLQQPGTSFSGKTETFSPGGSIFKIVSGDPDPASAITANDLMAAYRLQRAANNNHFGHQGAGERKNSRRQTRYLFYYVAVDMVRSMLEHFKRDSQRKITLQEISRAVRNIFECDDQAGSKALVDNALNLVDEYMNQPTKEDSLTVHKEPLYVECNMDLNRFLKLVSNDSAKLPKLTQLLMFFRLSMKRSKLGELSDFENMRDASKTSNDPEVLKFLQEHVVNYTVRQGGPDYHLFGDGKLWPVAAVKGRVRAELKNWMGSFHGLVTAALVDLVTSWAICAYGKDYLDHSSVSLEVNYLKGAKVGDVLEIDGICDKFGRTLSFTSFRMFLKGTEGDEKGLIALGQHVKFMPQGAKPKM